MTEDRPTPIDHRPAWELLPWLINDSLTASQRAPLEEHLRECLLCRRELHDQKLVHGLIKSRPTSVLSSGEAFAHLRARLNHRSSAATDRAPRWSRPTAWAAVGVIVVLATGILLIDASRESIPNDEPRFRTLTTEPSAETVDLHVLFAPGVSAADRREIIESIGGRITGEAGLTGVYGVQLRSPPVDGSDTTRLLEQLQRDGRVTFAGPAYRNGDQP